MKIVAHKSAPATSEPSGVHEAPRDDGAPPTAQEYADAGLAPIKIKKRDKKPIGKGWQLAPIDAGAVDAWIAQGGNVGLRMGAQPGGLALVALDEDEPGALASAEAELGALPETLTSRTGGGGQHQIFAWPAERPFPKNKVQVGGRKFDVRSQGGQIIVAPSRSAKGAYTWADWRAPVELPAAWVDALLASGSTRAHKAKPHASSSDDAALEHPNPTVSLSRPYWATGSRHEFNRGLASKLAQWGKSDEYIESVFRDLGCDRPGVGVEHRVSEAKKAAEQAREYYGVGLTHGERVARVNRPRGIRPPGWEVLVECLGAETARLIEAHENPNAKRDAPPAPAPALDGNVGDRFDHDLGKTVDLDTPITEVRMLVESLGIAWAGKVAAIHGYATTSKGLLLSLVALHVASGTPLFGKPVARVPVLYVDAETEPLASARMKRLARGMGVDLGALQRDGWIKFIDAHGELKALTPAIGEALKKLDKGEGALVCVDSYSSLVAGDEIKSEYADPMWELGQSLRQVNAVGLVVMHERKTVQQGNGKASALEGISGTNRLAAALVTSIRMTRDDESNECRLLVTSTRAPGKRFAPFYLTWTDREDGAIVANVEITTIAAKRGPSKNEADAARKALNELNANKIEFALRTFGESNPGARISVSALRGLAGLRLDYWSDALPICQKRGTVVVESGEKRGTTMLRAVPLSQTKTGQFTRTAPAKAEPAPDMGAAVADLNARLRKGASS